MVIIHKNNFKLFTYKHTYLNSIIKIYKNIFLIILKNYYLITHLEKTLIFRICFFELFDVKHVLVIWLIILLILDNSLIFVKLLILLYIFFLFNSEIFDFLLLGILLSNLIIFFVLGTL